MRSLSRNFSCSSVTKINDPIPASVLNQSSTVDDRIYSNRRRQPLHCWTLPSRAWMEQIEHADSEVNTEAIHCTPLGAFDTAGCPFESEFAPLEWHKSLAMCARRCYCILVASTTDSASTVIHAVDPLSSSEPLEAKVIVPESSSENTSIGDAQIGSRPRGCRRSIQDAGALQSVLSVMSGKNTSVGIK